MIDPAEQQTEARGWQQATALIVLGAATLVLMGGLFINLMSGANVAEILGLARQYLFRNALKNTLIVTTVAVALGAFVTRLGMWGSNGRPGSLLRWSLLLPLVMPAALVALTGRMAFFSTNGWLQQPLMALLLFGVIAAWRATPFLIFLPLVTPYRGAKLWIGILGIAAYVAISDVTTPLLLTGGQPFNATHTLASWTYQLAAVNGAWEAGAAAAIVWIGLLIIPVVAILVALHHIQTDQTGDKASDNRQAPSLSGIIMLLIAFWLLIPLGLLLFRNIGWLRALGPLVRNTGYWQWWLNTLVLGIMVGAVAVPTTAFAGSWLTANHGQWRARVAHGLLALALLSWPVLFLPVGWLADQREIHPEWLLWLPLSAVATCAGVWLSTQTMRRGRPETAMWAALAVSFFVVWHDLTLTLILRHPPASQSIGPATVSALGGSTMAGGELLTAAILLTTSVAWLVVGSAVRKGFL